MAYTLLAFGAGVHLVCGFLGRTVSALQNEVEIKEARNQYLQLEISRMQSPENITKLAEEKLKLKPIKPHKVIILED